MTAPADGEASSFEAMAALAQLQELCEKLVACADLKAVLDEILTAAISLNKADFGTVQLFDPERRVLAIAAQRGFRTEFLEFFREVGVDGDSACARAMRERRPIMVEDVAADEAFAPCLPAAEAAGFRAVLSVPLISSGGDFVGMLSTHFRESCRVSDNKLRMIVLYARRAADLVRRFHSEAALADVRERHRFLVDQLNHRVKNVLAVVQAIANQTLRRAQDPAEFVASFGGRLRALATAQELLGGAGWKGVDLIRLLREETLLAEISGGEGGRLLCTGPTVAVDPEAALHLVLAFYELGTNARKYGALSVPTGRVLVSWTVTRQDDTRLLTLTWRESGGPPVVAPDRTGFGCTLLRRVFRATEGGEASLVFDPSGVRWEARFPLRSAAVGDPAEEEWPWR